MAGGLEFILWGLPPRTSHSRAAPSPVRGWGFGLWARFVFQSRFSVSWFWFYGSGIQISGFGSTLVQRRPMSGIGASDLGFVFRVSCSCFRFDGFGCMVWGFEFRVLGLGFKISDLGFGVWGLGFRVQGSRIPKLPAPPLKGAAFLLSPPSP